MQHAHRRYLVALELDQVVAHWVLLLVDLILLHYHLLLLLDCCIKVSHPLQDVPVAYCQLVGLTYFN